MAEISGYKDLRQADWTEEGECYRGVRIRDGKKVILSVVRGGRRFSDLRKRYLREHEIARSLGIPDVLKPCGIEERDDVLILELEDFGGFPLKALIREARFTIEEVVELALQLSRSLGEIHRCGVTHKDIRPANLFYNPATGSLKITGFGRSTVLPKEPCPSEVPKIVGDGLTYISPEQTGRMNHSLDYRTDFYSLGVTLYQFLTGRLPFDRRDDLELIYKHIAEEPVPPSGIDESAPECLSQIVMKLLAKSPDERYQSAHGLTVDLEICQKRLGEAEAEEVFRLGSEDASERLQIPEKLYGREDQIVELMGAFNRVAEGAVEWMLVTGYSGIGKSSLVNEIRRPITYRRGYFIAGKSDQYKRHIPYSSIVEAFRELVRQILTETEERVERWKMELQGALGQIGNVVVDVIPEVELIIGPQPPVSPLPASESQNRFNLVFKNFVRVFASRLHPLVIFLDDLQWTDSASLKLIQLLVTDTEADCLLILGAYRDNEVDATHPLPTAIEEAHSAGARVSTVRLLPLELKHIQQLCSESLRLPPDRVLPLCRLALKKTDGNPFFLVQFLRHLASENILAFDSQSGTWQWDDAGIQNVPQTQNVVSMMEGKIENLAPSAQEAVKLASCIGGRFSLKILAIVYKKSPSETAADLWEALQANVIVPLTGDFHDPWPIQGIERGDAEYKFLHDRVQEAAYALIPHDRKVGVHLQVGRLLLREIPDEDREERLFDIVNQLNVGIDLITGRDERRELAHLNLTAGRKARSAAAYGSAHRYLQAGLRLLEENCWDSDYELALNLHVAGIEVEYLCTQFVEAQLLFGIVQENARTLLDKVKAFEIRIEFLITQNRMAEAIETALPVVEMLGYPVSPRSEDLRLVRELPTLEELETFPEMTDPAQLAALRLLTIITGAAYQGEPEMYAPIVFGMMNLVLENGHSPLAAYTYGVYGSLLCGPLEDIETGHHAGQVALLLQEKSDAKESECRVRMLFDSFVRHWKERHSLTISALAETIQTGLETGDVVYSTYCCIWSCGFLFLSGHQLSFVEEKQRQYGQLAESLRLENGLYPAKIWRQLALNLQGDSDERFRLTGESYRQEDIERVREIDVVLTLFFERFAKLLLAYLFRRFDEAFEHAEAASDLSGSAIASMLAGGFVYYDSLARLAYFERMDSQRRRETIQRVETNLQSLRKWAEAAPVNFESKRALVEAETARIAGRFEEAAAKYETAIRLAKEQQFPLEGAIAAERAADFWEERGVERFVRGYVREAAETYERWGAKAKVEALRASHSRFFVHTVERPLFAEEADSFAREPTEMDSPAELDAQTLLEASLILSGELDLNRLLVKLTQLAIENAGAQRGVLVLERAGNLEIQTIATRDAEETEASRSVSLRGSRRLSEAMVRYVFRTGEDVVLHDASAEGMFFDDPYIVENDSRSVLCTPIRRHERVIGALYLENDLATHVFTEERLAVLSALLTQAAISLENAELFAKQRQAESEIRKIRNYLSNIVNSMPSILVGVDANGKVTQWNREAEVATGVSSKDAHGRLLGEVFPQLAGQMGRVRESIRECKPVKDTKVLARVKGETRFEDVTVYPLVTNGAEGAVIRVDDVTERVRIEEMMIQSEKMLSVGGLAAGMAHEINNPLAGILQNIQVLRNRISSDLPKNREVAETCEVEIEAIETYMEVRGLTHMIDAIIESGKRAARIVENMLSFSRKGEARFALHDVSDLLDQTVELAQNDYDLKKKQDFRQIEIVREYEQNVPPVPCEGSKIQQVFLNLLKNGAEAMHGSGGREPPRFFLRVMCEEDAVRVEVEDNGPGMDDATRKRVFEPFYTTKEVGVGTGLGLSVSYFIVSENHGGTLTVEPPVGGGARFVVRLPIEKARLG